jgi:hypothetical protein
MSLSRAVATVAFYRHPNLTIGYPNKNNNKNNNKVKSKPLERRSRVKIPYNISDILKI